MELVTVEEKQVVEKTQGEFGGMLTRAIELSKHITDDNSFRAAADHLLAIKQRRRWWADFMKPAKQKLDGLKKELLERERQIDEPMERAETLYLKPALLAYDVKKQNERRAEEARIANELKKQQEESQMATAEALESQGRRTEADIVLSEEVVAPPVVLQKTHAVTGISSSTTWHFKVIDPTKVPREYLMLDEQKIRATVKAWKKAGEVIPGIEAYSEAGIRAGGR